ncbi:MAG: UDP-glucose/GDP-mannose dehydrogenase family protein [Phycisphaerae bacterium]|nr:UDP-glucose/GDP-mannose dehydrogenase family protein [Phycisphaerae bacterium]
MKIAVVGIGYVGLVAAAGLSESGNHIICVDNDENKIKSLKKGIIPIYEPGLAEIIKENEKAGRLSFTTDLKAAVDDCKLIILGVGTPSADDGSADISAVLDVCGQIAEYMKDYRIIITKSTVPVGTYKKVTELIKSKTKVRFDYVSNPEFLKEGSAVADFAKPDRVIIGTDNPDVQEIMKQLYSPFMRKGSRIIFMSPASAELTKYASNVMLATRISFMNELSGLCDKFGADIEEVRAGVGSDPRIGNSFLFAGVGFGGSCFPKDVKALIHIGRENNCRMTIVEAVQQANYVQHNRFADKILNYFKGRENKTILAVWGLAFKAKTDDVRESPAVWCIKKFVQSGMKIRAFDPEAMETAKTVLNNSIETGKDDYSILSGADGLVIFTEWQQFRMPDFDLIKEKLKKPVIFDGRNLYEPAYMKKMGFEYYCIGRP